MHTYHSCTQRDYIFKGQPFWTIHTYYNYTHSGKYWKIVNQEKKKLVQWSFCHNPCIYYPYILYTKHYNSNSKRRGCRKGCPVHTTLYIFNKLRNYTYVTSNTNQYGERQTNTKNSRTFCESRRREEQSKKYSTQGTIVWVKLLTRVKHVVRILSVAFIDKVSLLLH